MRALFTAFAIFLLALPAAAVPVTWQLQNVAFDDGGSASGSFVYDADTDEFSAVSITTTSGSSFAGRFYDVVGNNGGKIFPTGTGFLLSFNEQGTDTESAQGQTEFFTALTADLTNDATQVAFDVTPILFAPAAEYTCGDVFCEDFINIRQITSGSVVAVSDIPLPASAGLLLIAIAGVMSLRRPRAPR